MDKIGTYQAYQNNYYETSLQKKRNKEAAKAEQSDKVGMGKQPNLSKKAKALLEELKKTYTNMDFFVADYKTEEEAAAYLSQGTKEYSVLIDTETLEEMAADDKVKEKYLGILDDAKGKLSDIKEELAEKGETVQSIGISIKEDGTVSYFANLEKNSEKQRERIEESKKKNQEEAASEESKKAAEGKRQYGGGIKKTTVRADSMEELLDKIRNVDWDKIKMEKMLQTGSRFETWM